MGVRVAVTRDRKTQMRILGDTTVCQRALLCAPGITLWGRPCHPYSSYKEPDFQGCQVICPTSPKLYVLPRREKILTQGTPNQTPCTCLSLKTLDQTADGGCARVHDIRNAPFAPPVPVHFRCPLCQTTRVHPSLTARGCKSYLYCYSCKEG